MTALRWDEQAQAYTESETPMKYDQTAGAWTNTTGMAWDNEAQAWTERWGTKVSAYVYGAVSETITIRKNGIVVATVQTDSSGRSTEMVSLDTGTYDMTGSVSGWTEEQVIDSRTDKFRAMPEGKILYWYGYNTIGFKVSEADMGWGIYEYKSSVKFSKNTNSFSALSIYGNYIIAGLESESSIDFTEYNKINVIAKRNNVRNTFSCDISSESGSFYIIPLNANSYNNYSSMFAVYSELQFPRNAEKKETIFSLESGQGISFNLDALWME